MPWAAEERVWACGVCTGNRTERGSSAQQRGGAPSAAAAVAPFPVCLASVALMVMLPILVVVTLAVPPVQCQAGQP